MGTRFGLFTPSALLDAVTEQADGTDHAARNQPCQST